MSIPRRPTSTRLYETYRPGRGYRVGDVVRFGNTYFRATRSTSQEPAVSATPGGNIGNTAYWQLSGYASVVSDTQVNLISGTWQNSSCKSKEVFHIPSMDGLDISARSYLSTADYWWFGIIDGATDPANNNFWTMYGIRCDVYQTNTLDEVTNGSYGSTVNITTAGTYTWRLHWDVTSATTMNMTVFRDSTQLVVWESSIPSYVTSGNGIRLALHAQSGGAWGPFSTYDRPGGEIINSDWEVAGGAL